MHRLIRSLLIVMALAMLASPGRCQITDMTGGNSLKGVLSGATPLTLQLKDLDSSWRHVSAGVLADNNSAMQMYGAMMLGGGLGDVYYTKGDMITQGGETFLIAYRSQSEKIDFSKLMRGGTPNSLPKPKPMMPETNLSLTLLNLRTLTNLSDIRPFNLEDELADSKKSATDVASLLNDGSTYTEDVTRNPNAQSESNLKQVGLALTQYVQDYDELYPPMKSAAHVQKVLMPYCKNAAIFVQPETKQPYQMNATLSGRSLAEIDAPAECVAFYEADADSDGKRAVLFTDGHVKRIVESEWQSRKAAWMKINSQPAPPVRTAPPKKRRRGG